MCILLFTFIYGETGTCVWSGNEEAMDKFGGCIISLDEFPLSDDFKIILKAMCEEYQTYLNWEYPPDPSPWTEKHKADFRKRAKEGYDRFVKEVGPDFIVENRVDVL